MLIIVLGLAWAYKYRQATIFVCQILYICAAVTFCICPGLRSAHWNATNSSLSPGSRHCCIDECSSYGSLSALSAVGFCVSLLPQPAGLSIVDARLSPLPRPPFTVLCSLSSPARRYPHCNWQLAIGSWQLADGIRHLALRSSDLKFRSLRTRKMSRKYERLHFYGWRLVWQLLRIRNVSQQQKQQRQEAHYDSIVAVPRQRQGQEAVYCGACIRWHCYCCCVFHSQAEDVGHIN